MGLRHSSDSSFGHQTRSTVVGFQSECAHDSERIAAISLQRKLILTRAKAGGRTRNRVNKLEQTVGKLSDDVEKSFPIRMQRALEIVHRLKRHWEEFKITRFHSNNLKANIIDGPVASIPDADAQERNTGLFLEICGLRALETDYQLTL